MSDRDDLERRLEAWLHETARPMPPELLEEIVATAPRANRAGVRAVFPSGRRWRFTLAGLAAAVVLAVIVGVTLRGPLGPGASATPSVSSPVPSATSASPSVSPSAGSTPSAPVTGLGVWHRNNYNAGEEQLTCREGAGSWTCTYELPDATGSFVGQDVTDSWACPAWFPSPICNKVTTIYRGIFVCCLLATEQPSAGTPAPVNQEFLITEVDGQAVLQVYWVDRFVCPWYRTFQDALAHDFNCAFAPGVSGP